MTTGVQSWQLEHKKQRMQILTCAQVKEFPEKISLLPAYNWTDRRIPQIAEQKSDDWIYYQPSFEITVPQHQVILATSSTKHASHILHPTVKHIRSQYILKK